MLKKKITDSAYKQKCTFDSSKWPPLADTAQHTCATFFTQEIGYSSEYV